MNYLKQLEDVVSGRPNKTPCRFGESHRPENPSYMKDTFPFIPGWDVSGVVEAMGSGTRKFRKGCQVYARPGVTAHGRDAYAQYAVVKEIETALKPKSIHHAHAATIPVGAVTSWRAGSA